MSLDELCEQLAAIEHERWADWQRYQHSLCYRHRDGLIIPSLLVARWERQIATPYADLSEAEKASDREQVNRYWPLVVALREERDEARARLHFAHSGEQRSCLRYPCRYWNGIEKRPGALTD